MKDRYIDIDGKVYIDNTPKRSIEGAIRFEDAVARKYKWYQYAGIWGFELFRNFFRRNK